jgi:PEP-CTERM motif
MKSFSFVAGVVFCAAAFVVPIKAEAISGTFDGTATLTPTQIPGVFVINFTGDGDDNTLGPFTPTGHSTIDFSNPPNIVLSGGSITETFADGTLFGTTSGSGSGNGNGTANFTIDFMITGGTGEFYGDTGEAALTGTITQTSPTTDAIRGTYTGSVAATPEPSTWMLLVTGLAAVCRLRRH